MTAIPDESLCSDWPEQVQQWQQTLHNLATEFTQGESIAGLTIKPLIIRLPYSP